MQAGHERGAGGVARRRAGIVVGQSQASGSKGIDVRSLYFLLPVTAQIAVTQVVGHDENDVGDDAPRTAAGSAGVGPVGCARPSVDGSGPVGD